MLQIHPRINQQVKSYKRPTINASQLTLSPHTELSIVPIPGKTISIINKTSPKVEETFTTEFLMSFSQGIFN